MRALCRLRNDMKNITKITAVMITITCLLGTIANGQSLPAGKWQLDGYNFKQKIAFPIDKKHITLNIDTEGAIGGRSGCNVYGGSYAFVDGRLKISDIFSTMMACDAMTMQFERTFYEVLGAASEFSKEGRKLTLTDPKTLSFLRFVRVRKDSCDDQALNEAPSADSSSRPAKKR